MSDDDIIAKKEAIQQLAVQKANVRGIGIGPQLVDPGDRSKRDQFTVPARLAIAIFYKHEKPDISDLVDDDGTLGGTAVQLVDVTLPGDKEDECFGPGDGDPAKYTGKVSGRKGNDDPHTGRSRPTIDQPLEGGIRIGMRKMQFDPKLNAPDTNPSYGTAGCFVTRGTAGGTRYYYLTNAHVVSIVDRDPQNKPRADDPRGRKVGQSEPAVSSSTNCSDDSIGQVFSSKWTADVDAAIIAIRPKFHISPRVEDGSRRWPADEVGDPFPGEPPQEKIENDGVVKGTAAITPSDLLALASQNKKYEVKKRGSASGVTHGFVSHVEVFGANDDEIKDASGNPAFVRSSRRDICVFPLLPFKRFSCHGDSGSVIINPSGNVVALLWGSESGVQTYGIPIKDVETQLGVQVLTGQNKTDEVVVPDHNLEGAPADTEALLRLEAARAKIISDLRQTDRGARIVELLLRNQLEVRALLQNDRRVAAHFHRTDGPLLVRELSRAILDPAHRLAGLVDGQPLKDSLTELASVLRSRGSPQLRSDLDELEPVLRAVVESSVAEVITTLRG
jgi:hypothetical protein